MDSGTMLIGPKDEQVLLVINGDTATADPGGDVVNLVKREFNHQKQSRSPNESQIAFLQEWLMRWSKNHPSEPSAIGWKRKTLDKTPKVPEKAKT